MSANIERIISDHCPTTLEDLDAEIGKTLERLRDLQRRRVVISMHLAVSEACDPNFHTLLHAADTHDYTDSPTI